MSHVKRAGLENNSAFKPALMLMSGRAVAFAATFFIPVLLVRIFTQTEFGTYKQFFLVINILYGIGQMGMAESLFYFLPSAKTPPGRYVVNSMLSLGGVGLICAMGLWAASDIIAARFRNVELGAFMPVAGVYLLFMLCGSVLEIVLISRKRYQAATLSYMTSDLIRAVMLIAPGVMFQSIGAVFLGGVAFYVMRTVIAAGYVRNEFKGDLQPDSAVLGRQLSYALPFAMAVVIEVLQANYHHLAVSSYFDAATFAVYAVGCLQIPLVEFLASPASNVMMVRMQEEIRDGRQHQLLPIWHNTTRKLALLFFPLVGLLVVTAGTLITFLFTTDYIASVPVFMVWSLSILFAAFQTDGVMRVFAQTRFLIVINVVRLTAIAAVMGWFLRHLHLVGAVIVTLVGIVIAKSMALIRMKSLLNVGLLKLLPWRDLGSILMAAMIAAVPVAFLTRKLELAAYLDLPMSGVVYMTVYAALIVLFRVLTPGERQQIAVWAARVMPMPARRSE